MAIEDQRFHPVEHPGGTPSPGPGSHGTQWISVTELVEGHRSPGSPGGEIRQERIGSEGLGRQGGHDRRGEEGAGQRDPPGLVEHNAQIREAAPGTAEGFGYHQPCPTQTDQCRPQLGIDPIGVIGHLSQSRAPDLAVHGLPGDIPKRLLFGVVGEVHRSAAVAFRRIGRPSSRRTDGDATVLAPSV